MWNKKQIKSGDSCLCFIFKVYNILKGNINFSYYVLPVYTAYSFIVEYFDPTRTLTRLPIKLNLEPEGGVSIQLARINSRVFVQPRLE